MSTQEAKRRLDPEKSEQQPQSQQGLLEVLLVLPQSSLIAGNDILAKSFFSLAKALSSQSSKITFLVFDHGPQTKEQVGEFLAQCSISGIELQYLLPDRYPHLVGPASACTSYLFYLWLSENDRYDVVHVPDWLGLGFYAQIAKHQGLRFPDVHFVVDVYGPSFWRAAVEQRFPVSAVSLATDFIERESVRLADSLFAPLPVLLNVIEAEGWMIPKQRYWLQLAQKNTIGSIGSASGDQDIKRLSEIIYFGALDQRDGLASFCDAIDSLAGSLRDCQLTFRGFPPYSQESELRSYLEKRSKSWQSPWQFVPTEDFSTFDCLKGDGKLVIIGGTTLSSLVLAIQCGLSGAPLLYNSYATRRRESLVPLVSSASFFDSDEDLKKHLSQAIQYGVVRGKEGAVSAEHKDWWKDAHATMFRTGERHKTPTEDKPLVSVCLAHYNRPQLLRMALQSLDRQTYHNFEVIVGDDGSDGEGVQQELDKLEEQYKNRGWRVLRLPHRNVGATRTSVAAEATGEYLLFMDDDNIARADELATLVAVSLRTEADIVTSAFDAFEDKDGQPGEKPSYRKIFLGQAIDCGLTENVFGDANALIRRNLFVKLNGFDDEPAVAWQDWDFFARAVLGGAHLEAVPEPLYFYRTSETSMNKTSSEWRSAQSVIRQYQKAIPRQFAALPGLLFGMSRAASNSPPQASDILNTTPRSSIIERPEQPEAKPTEKRNSSRQPLVATPEISLADRTANEVLKQESGHAVTKSQAGPRSLTERLQDNRIAKVAWWMATGKLPGKIMQRQRRLNQLDSSPFFDKKWYQEKYGVADPLKHYFSIGGAQGLDPGPNFNTRWYRERYPDSQSITVTPLEHFIEVGIPLHRTARPEDEPDFAEFDAGWYQHANPDLSNSTIMPFAHYLQFGKNEGRTPNHKADKDFDIFDAQWYREQYDGFGKSDQDLFFEYVSQRVHGKFANEDRQLQSVFNADWYKARYQDSLENDVDLFQHYKSQGRKLGLAPCAEADPEAKDFDAEWYCYRYPDVEELELPPLWHYLLYGRKEGRLKRPVDGPSSVAAALERRFPLQQPLRMFAQPKAEKRISVFFENLQNAAITGRSATALLLAMLCAEQTTSALRIVSRDAGNVAHILSQMSNFYDFKIPGSPELVQYDGAQDDSTITPSDLMLTTSWQTTVSVSKTTPANQIVYLVQEDERLLLRGHDDLLRCNEALSHTGARFVVSTASLLQHLKNSGLNNFNNRSLSFEPAFPQKQFFPRASRTILSGARNNFLFYAEPQCSEALYYRGLEVIAHIVEQGILEETDWNIYFIGAVQELPTLPRNAKVNALGHLSNADYVQVLGETDLGLALMHTPHAGYPTLELASSGAVAVTNKYANKNSLASICENILCADPSVESLTEAIMRGMRLVADEKLRGRNYSKRQLNTDWRASFSQIVPWLLKDEA
jgi:GT2 family glycosyltransferase